MCLSTYRKPVRPQMQPGSWGLGCVAKHAAGKRRGIYHGLWLLYLAATFFLLLPCPAKAQVKQVRRVLILNDLGVVSSPGFAEVDQALFNGLQESRYQIELYQESLELALFPDEASQRRF